MFASEKCTDVKNTRILNLVVQKFDFWRSTLGGLRGEVAPTNYVEIFVCKVSVDIQKKKLAPFFEPNKKLIFDCRFGRGFRGGYFQMTSKHSSLRYVLITKKKLVP